jgi:hypothetical protein
LGNFIPAVSRSPAGTLCIGCGLSNNCLADPLFSGAHAYIIKAYLALAVYAQQYRIRIYTCFNSHFQNLAAAPAGRHGIGDSFICHLIDNCLLFARLDSIHYLCQGIF